ncbi:MFS transporter [Aeromonas simiae]|uniref:MFS transporter n=1 Tax=Aeromonas simiae TaxID=218936 RepID=UPI00266BEAC5|nr:MFS transporter [Aeromonas simiae]MDO2948060.1 MFS transporter [Aeromonas simiae]MDO2953108.1 MFS transporter [Aeromonas simiae]MDO2955521.1 MFS transporter [Aeromonas simiae]
MNDFTMAGSERRATWALGAVFSLRMLGMFMVLPVLTTYGMSLAGASEPLIGVAIGIYGLTQALFQIPFGLLSDRIGRKPLIGAGLLLFAAGSVLAATSHSIWGVIAGRALQGSGAISAAVMALLSDLTREQNRTKAMAFIGVSFGITFAVAMVTGPLITRAVGLSGLFWLIALLALAALALVLWVVPAPAAHLLNRESAMVRGSFRAVLSNPRLLKLNVGILCVHTLLMSSFVALPPLLVQAGLPRESQWQAYLVTMLIAFVSVVPFIIYAEKRRQMRRVFQICVLVMLAAELTLWQSGSQLWGLLAGLQLFFIGFNVMEALLPSLISKESPPGYKGTAMGVYSTSQFLGVAIGGSLGGFLYGQGGAALVFAGCAALALAWFALSLTMSEPPYVSSLRIVLPEGVSADAALEKRIRACEGVSDVLLAGAEHSIYVKVDTKRIGRSDLERLVAT